MTGLRHRIHNKSLDPLGVFWFELDVFLKTEIHFLDIILLNIGGKKMFSCCPFTPSMKGC